MRSWFTNIEWSKISQMVYISSYFRDLYKYSTLLILLGVKCQMVQKHMRKFSLKIYCSKYPILLLKRNLQFSELVSLDKIVIQHIREK